MSIPEEDPRPPLPSCPWHATTRCVEPATDHEHDRTGMRWHCNDGAGALFEGTQTEFQRIRARVLADMASEMTTRPRGDQP